MRHRLLQFGVAGAIALAGAQAAQAAPCSGLPDPIYVAGSSAVGPLIPAFGKPLAGTTTLIYQNQGSCTGVNAVANDATPTGACATGACITGTATYYDSAGTSHTCDLDANGTHVDVGISDVYGTTCTSGAPLPAGIGDFDGAVQTMLFVVPKTSTQVAIWAEEAYFVMGFDAGGGVTPWVDTALHCIRNALSGTQNMLAKAIGVPAAKWKGTDEGGSGGVLTAISGAQGDSIDKSIGIISADFYDAHRDALKSLAFQAYGQYAAYFADSTATATDKKNVRDGHYVVWGYFHMIAHTDNQGAPTTTQAQRFIDWVQNKPTNPVAPFDPISVEIQQAHMIPKCAMKVQRTTEVGDSSLYTDPAPCGCYFDSLVATTTCTQCDANTPCATGTCRYGYCEAQ